MNEILASYTSLPNLHPALVHFPIALLPTAVLFDLLAVSIQKQKVWLDPLAEEFVARERAGEQPTRCWDCHPENRYSWVNTTTPLCSLSGLRAPL